ncbi:NAD(P)/FAD-dependent oxidoreductase [Pseudonocardia sp. EV170527-09]|uniref:phytoene desaturase family protein n=1 Tax=Pseudonocardia sp. EV170527-09 TaxID=2603411 RepID=UPI0011F3A711|nr:NAD(P)/FAD-dependent oxidoreductase [Pseudonocardia sp. EV170527-09]KAA1029032.1 NAD(P)/FAD-dependent oxidoreductase [Pseudonocardia sp. EV170527-09]
MSTATVVGSGPNGLVAAAVLARAGVEVTVLEAADEIGGGTRTVEAIVPGLLVDHCSAVHPMAVGSPVLAELGLDRHGLRWRLPEVDCAHPLDDGDAGILLRSVTDTAAGLGADGPLWRALFGSPSRSYDALSQDFLGPLLRFPGHPLLLARFGAPTVLPAELLARAFRTERGRALFLGTAAHAFRPLNRPLSSAIGMGILTAGHRYGWGVAQGGSRAISDALATVLAGHGAKIETGVHVRSADELGDPDVVVWDVGPDRLPQLLGDRLPPRAARAYRRFRYGPAAFKVDYAVQGGIPWASPGARRAGTVHVAGSAAETALVEREVHAGRMPERPFVLVGQQYLADPTRSVGDVHPVYAYAHVPYGYTGDATAAITAQIERFAPGFRERVVGTLVTDPATFAGNPNFVGGNILTGAKDLRQLVLGPRTTLQPYDTGAPGHFLCSAATPPGPGAHGMCGAHAARRALAHLGR